MADPVESLNAVTLATADMAAAVAFYDALGFRRVSGSADEAFTTYRVGPATLNLQLDPAHAPLASIWGRVIFFVDDVDSVYARVVAAGFRPSAEPADGLWGERYFHVHDPDGHELSFARPIKS